jgi:hypothetical protein
MEGINESSFIANILPREKIAFLKLLELFDVKLLQILKEELRQGNRILNVSGTVSDETVVVVLSQPFKSKYEKHGLQFSSLNDPHDGGDYYSTPQPKPCTLVAPLKR